MNSANRSVMFLKGGSIIEIITKYSVWEIRGGIKPRTNAPVPWPSPFSACLSTSAEFNMSLLDTVLNAKLSI